MSSTFKSLVYAIRPKTLLLGLCPIILGNSLAYSYLLNTSSPSASFYINFLLTLLSVLFMQSAANLVNDVKDFEKGIDTENRKGPTRAIQSGMIPISTAKIAYKCLLGLAFIICLYFTFQYGSIILLVGISCLLAAYLYTGGPYPLAYFALGEVLSLVFFGPVSVGTIYYLQTGVLNSETIWVSLSTGLLAAGVMAINNYRDRDTDNQSGKKTIATLLDKKPAYYFTIFLTLIPVYILFHYGLNHNKLGLSLFFVFILLAMWKKVLPKLEDDGITLNSALANTAKYSLVFTFLLTLNILI